MEIRQRYREIGIQKVNGATTLGVLWLLICRFPGLILIAFGIAAPIAWWIIRLYQENFIEATPVSCWLFIADLGLTALIILITLYQQSYKAAITNPVDVLKNE